MDTSAFLDTSGNTASAFTDANSSSSQQPSAFTDTTPNDVSMGKSKLGSQDYNGFCEKFQEQITGSPNMGGTAYEAWNNYAKNGRAFQGLQGATPGDKVYFTGDGGLGHTGVISSIDPQSNDATFISATDNGVQELPISSWLKSTGEHLLGFAR